MIILILGIGLAIFASFITSPQNKTVTANQVEMAKEKTQNHNWYPLFVISIFVMGAVIIGRTV